MSEPLPDDEIIDRLHAMAFELEHLTGETKAGDTALKASRAALLAILAGLITLNEREPSLGKRPGPHDPASSGPRGAS